MDGWSDGPENRSTITCGVRHDHVDMVPLSVYLGCRACGPTHNCGGTNRVAVDTAGLSRATWQAPVPACGSPSDRQDSDRQCAVSLGVNVLTLSVS